MLLGENLTIAEQRVILGALRSAIPNLPKKHQHRMEVRLARRERQLDDLEKLVADIIATEAAS